MVSGSFSLWLVVALVLVVALGGREEGGSGGCFFPLILLPVLAL